MKLDMHFHSVASDGKNTRDELLEEWQKKRASVFSSYRP